MDYPIVVGLETRRPVLRRHPDEPIDSRIDFGDTMRFIKLRMGAAAIRISISEQDYMRLYMFETKGPKALWDEYDHPHGYSVDGYPPEAQDRA